MGMIGLESSVNPESGLGLVAVATPHLILIIATGFLAPAALKLLGSKVAIIVGYIGLLAFILANYYPHWITLIVGSIIMGLLYNIAVVSLYDHASTVARMYFKSLKDTQENAIYLYTSCIALSAKSASFLEIYLLPLSCSQVIQQGTTLKNPTKSFVTILKQVT